MSSVDTSSACERVLSCPELLSLILDDFAILRTQEDSTYAARSPKRATLAACARVSRAFSEHALDLLWETLDNMIPLLRLFPCFKKVTTIYVFAGDLEEGWPRFQRHAARVRSIRYFAHKSVQVHPSVWTLLARRTGTHGLLPNLQRLSAMDITFAEIAPVTLLFSPSLREVDLYFRKDSKTSLTPAELSPVATAMFDELVKTTGPHLETLCLFRPFPLDPSRIHALRGFHELRDLFLSDADYTVLGASGLRVLEQLERLRGISINIRLEDCETAADLHLERGFPTLDELWLEGSASDFAKLIVAGRFGALQRLYLTISGSTDLSTLQDCISTASAHLPANLPYLHIHAKQVSASSPTVGLGEVLRPLYALKHLESVECDLGTYVPHVTDVDLEELARAWPQLDWFRVGGGAHPPNARQLSQLQRPSVLGLVHLAQHCPRLRTINLPSLETAQLPPPDAVPVLGRVRTKWLTLCWAPSMAGDERTQLNFATLLDRLFANLEKFEIKAQGPSYTAVWRSVRRYLEAMQAGRRHARVLRGECETELLAGPDCDGEPGGMEANTDSDADRL